MGSVERVPTPCDTLASLGRIISSEPSSVRRVLALRRPRDSCISSGTYVKALTDSSDSNQRVNRRGAASDVIFRQSWHQDQLTAALIRDVVSSYSWAWARRGGAREGARASNGGVHGRCDDDGPSPP